MKQKKIAVLLAMALTFSQSTGVVMPVIAEELTEDAGLVESQSENNEETEMAETTEAENGPAESAGAGLHEKQMVSGYCPDGRARNPLRIGEGPERKGLTEMPQTGCGKR